MKDDLEIGADDECEENSPGSNTPNRKPGSLMMNTLTPSSGGPGRHSKPGTFDKKFEGGAKTGEEEG